MEETDHKPYEVQPVCEVCIFPQNKYLYIKSGSHMDSFFEYKKTENNFRQKILSRRGIQTRGRHIAEREKRK